MLIGSVAPDFESRNEILSAIAKSTCFIGVLPDGPNSKPISGTAFFVLPNILLTAGHLVPDTHRKIVAQFPGTRQAVVVVNQLFRAEPRVGTFECELVETGYRNIDISVLRVKGDYQSPNCVQIERHIFPKDGPVDVIGYPGCYNENYIELMMPGGAVDRNAINRVTSLFPKCELVISHGVVASEGHRPTYHLSTVVGMSGSPVVLNGSVAGHRPTSQW